MCIRDRYIPIVVHVVYYEDFERISDEQIASQIELLNADFSALLIPAGIPDEFANLYEDVGIRSVSYTHLTLPTSD